MSEIIYDTDALNPNQQGLAELIWALEMSQGRFKLMLVRCNYGTLRDVLVGTMSLNASGACPRTDGATSLFNSNRELG
jgi:hypothetical protein